jgi:hypothetical protein
MLTITCTTISRGFYRIVLAGSLKPMLAEAREDKRQLNESTTRIRKEKTKSP